MQAARGNKYHGYIYIYILMTSIFYVPSWEKQPQDYVLYACGYVPESY